MFWLLQKLSSSPCFLMKQKWLTMPETQAEITSENVPYLNHIFHHCLKGQALIAWNSFAGAHPMEERTLENYSDDI